MKRFSKILTLILALVAILTAFTVVALADEEPQRFYYGDGSSNDFTFETAALGGIGDFDWSSSTARSNFVQIREAHTNGNRYLWFSGNQSNQAPAVYTYLSSSNSVRDRYNFSKTPIMSLDFDIMLINGTWGYASNSGNSSGFYFRPFYYVDATTGWKNPGYTTFTKFNFAKIGLSNEKYLWQHITVVAEYYTEIDAETSETVQKIGWTIYANGVETQTSTTNLSTTFTDLTYDQIGSLFIPEIYITATRYYANTSAHAPYGEQFAIDNMEYAFYEAGYDTSTIGTLIYNDSWEAPFGKLVAQIDYTDGEGAAATEYFDDMDEAVAFANANPGSVAVRVNDDGTTTPFSQIFPSVTVGDTVTLFADLGDAAEFAGANPGAKLTLVADITANYTVDSEITVDANVYDTDGTTILDTYAGIDTYAKTNVGYYMKETAEGSGIYVATKGDFMITTSAGVGTAYAAEDFAAKFAAVTTGSTVKLLNDIETSSSFTLGSAFNNVTLDLNGFDLTAVAYSGNVYQATYNEETQEYICDTTGTPTELTASSATLFTWNAASVTFTITSSVPGSSLANMTASADIWEYEGKVVKRVINSSAYGATMFNITKSSSTLNLSNISLYYKGYLIYQSSGAAGNHTVNFDNVNCYAMADGSYVIYSNHKTNFNFNVSNSLLYFPSGTNGYLYRWVNATTTPETQKTTVRFTNTDIISTKTSYSIRKTVATGVNQDELFDNCRFYNGNCSSWIANNGSLAYYTTETSNESYAPTAADGYEKVDTSVQIKYNYPSVTPQKTTDGLVETPSVAPATSEITLTYNKLITKPVDVNIVNAEGETIDTLQLKPGVDSLDSALPTLKKELENDALLNIAYQWADENGNAVSGTLALTNKGIAWQDSYTFYAKETLNGVTNYVGGIKVNFNLNFLSGFRYNLYIPVDARLTEMAVEGFDELPNTVLIGGEEYTVYSKIVGTAAAAEANVISATFKVDGVAYSQSWNINAISYADMLLEYYKDLEKYPNEPAAIGAMAKFIKEAVALTEGSSADVAAIDALIAKSGVDAEYGQYTEGNVNALADFNGIIADVQYSIFNGVAAYKFITVEEGTELTFTVNGEEIEATVSGTEITLEAMRVYDIIDPITVTCGDVSATFTMVDYLTKLNNAEGIEIAKALYEFGVAADAYKADIMANNK